MRKYPALIVGLGLLLIVVMLFVIILTGRDPESYIGSITTLIGVIVSSGVITQLLSKNTDATEATRSQTNGTLSKLHEQLEASHAREVKLAKLAGVDPDDLLAEHAATPNE
jgi:hypothetical protein